MCFPERELEQQPFAADAGWLYTEESLRTTRERSHERAVRKLRDTAEGPSASPGGQSSRKISVEDAWRLSAASARKIPELCTASGATPDATWTAIVLYKRFFAVKTPLEFDPVPMMLASVYAACKIEEFHEMTLDRLLNSTGFAGDDAMRAKVLSLELPLLEANEFSVHIEPKPEASLVMLISEIQRLLRGDGLITVAKDAPWASVSCKASKLISDLCTATDAVLRLPASTLFAGALRVAIDDCASWSGEERVAARKCLDAVLRSNLESYAQWQVVERSIDGIATQLLGTARSAAACAEDDVMEVVRSARRGHRFFERLREESARQHEVRRQERKRRWDETRQTGGFGVPMQLLQSFANLNRMDRPEDENWLHRIKEDYEGLTP
eukprot:TRINITY_DN1423_c1_g2_i1.p1 TRINITY_DN1423_c1_g2~~TRINITY_DN1423_c1_g2_i1.p1  ORF type:complete len:384 (-),score=76.27 TRINITY_DN1423_c1_g2_i1:261-1412(-)